MRYFTITFAVFVVVTMMSFTGIKKLSVTSTAFADNGRIPIKYSCIGAQASPPLAVGDIPAKTKSLALIVHDPDAPGARGFTHWVVFNMDVAGNIPENFKGAEEGLNGMRTTGYKSMCPPPGEHHYHFMVYALDVKLTLDKKTTGKAELEKAMEGHILASGDLVGLFDKSYK